MTSNKRHLEMAKEHLADAGCCLGLLHSGLKGIGEKLLEEEEDTQQWLDQYNKFSKCLRFLETDIAKLKNIQSGIGIKFLDGVPEVEATNRRNSQ